MKRALQKSIISTKEFLDKYFQKTTTPVTNSDDEVVEPSPKSTVSIKPTSPKLKVNPSETAKRNPPQQEKEIEKEKDIEKMPQSSLGEIRLRGVFKKPTPEMQRKMLYLKNKLLITNVQIKKHGIPLTDNFKHYYETAELLLQDYQSYVMNFLQRTEKTALQYIKDGMVHSWP